MIKLIILTLIFISSFTSAAMAEKISEGLQHITDGAQAVTFPHRNLKVAGNLYMPPNYEQDKIYPAVITVHPGGGVKEQTSGLYAKKLSD